MKTFKLWLEEKLAKRRITSSFLNALGFKKDALEKNVNISLDIIPEDRLKNAIQSLGVTPETRERLLTSIRNHKYQKVEDLLKQIGDEDVERQDTTTSQPAVLPPSNQPVPKPQRPQLMQQQQPPPMV